MKSDMGAVVRVMQLPDSGLEIRDRMWLKITIANAVIGEWSAGRAGAGRAGRAGLTCGWPGADVVDWLYTHVEGFKERREARRYASSMLKHGFLRHTVNKVTFSEQCYYVFGDLCSSEWGCGPGCPRGPGPLPSPSPAPPLARSRRPDPPQRLQWGLGPGHAGPAAPPGCPLAPGPGLPLPVPGAPALLPARVPGPRLQLRQRQCWESAE